MPSAIAEQPVKQANFLKALAGVGNITKAAEIAGVDRTAHYRWLDDPEYAERFEKAKEQAIEVMEAEAWRRGIDGVEEPVYQGGKLVGVVRKYSDVLLIFQLKAAKPEKYRDRFAGHLTVDAKVQTVGSDVDSLIEGEIARLASERLEELARMGQVPAAVEAEG